MTHAWLTEPSLNDSLATHSRNKGTRERGERGSRNKGSREIGHLAFPTYDRANRPLPSPVTRQAAMR